MRTTLGWLGQVFAWLVILGVVVALAVAVFVPRLAGATPYTVLTGSMRPHYPPGTLVVVKPTDTDDLQTGDVATYQITSGEPEVATHRILAVGVNLSGDRVFTFKGDANDAPDPRPVLPVQIKGKLWYAVPYLGYLNNALSGGQRQIAVWVVSALLIGYAAFMFVGAMRDRRRRPEQPARLEPVAATGSTTPVRGPYVPRPPDAVPLLLVGGGAAAFMVVAGFINRSRRRSTT
ncbi:signal peptidase I [Nocardioides ultimimeridianus]